MISRPTLNRLYWYCSKLSQPSIVLLIFTISCVAFIFSINTSENRYFEGTDKVSSLVESQQNVELQNKAQDVRLPKYPNFESTSILSPIGKVSSLVENQKVSFEKIKSLSTLAPIETSNYLKTTSKSASPKPSITSETNLKIPTNCICKSEKSGKSYNFRYVDPQNQTSIGKKFDCSHLNILENLGLVNNPVPFVDLTTFEKDPTDIVFVSATSDNHINQAIESITSFYKFHPTGKYILYSLALYSYQIKQIQSNFKNLEIRIFNTSEYPSYVTHWKEYRFKSLIIAEVMKEYSNIWWLDANIRVEKGNLTKLLREEIGKFVEKRGVENNFSEVLNLCQCESANRFYDFCYLNSRNSTSIGKKFSCDLVNTLGRLDLLEAPPEVSNISDAIKNESHVVFVSVTSDDYFNFSMSSLKCVRDFYPDHKFILYGLDLSSNYTEFIPDDPNLEFRRFDTTPYPKFVDDLKIAQLKGLILAEVIRDYPILFWINPDIAMRKPNVLKNLLDEILEYRTSEEYSPMISLSVMDNKNAAAVNRGASYAPLPKNASRRLEVGIQF
ncbi:unnamed protein product [Caenorhabditis nigoni]